MLMVIYPLTDHINELSQPTVFFNSDSLEQFRDLYLLRKPLDSFMCGNIMPLWLASWTIVKFSSLDFIPIPQETDIDSKCGHLSLRDLQKHDYVTSTIKIELH